ncbi:RICIN domain-containing protein [Kitasatospora sp. NPDC059577]|uniref:RICIN domain-containing protein n=1 Tax=Kitasatospora sp. NPDC059577 TaxID=3346873 RepID=UPI003691352A
MTTSHLRQGRPAPLTTARRLLVTAALGLATAAATVPAAPAASASQAGQYRISNVVTGKCLEVADWRTDDGAPVRQWTCTGGANQQWTSGPGSTIVNVHSGKCLEVPGFSTAGGTRIDQWTCNGGSNQGWFDSTQGPGHPHVYANVNSGLRLDLYGGSPEDGTPVIQWPLNGSGNQAWYTDVAPAAR